eukprot:TRINITY_DN1667_c0_g1_i11.p2 TRINITY_DN1667_c0_g1~~TRINITY_DN1667_c0_g1_i11.p2  ORF type:complete len:140 (-),score=28.23 TRINITY_DN1667_c0_g1_i11:551-970(-)
MNIVKFYTTAKSEALLKDVLAASQKAADSALKSFGLSPDSPLSSSEDFLAEFAQTIIAELRKRGYYDYNAIVGEDLVRVFRYRKGSMITLKWRELMIVVFQFPANPKIIANGKSLRNKVNEAELENRYGQCYIIGLADC